MLFKNLLKAAVLVATPFVAYAGTNCADPDKIDTDECKADILIVTTDKQSRTKSQDEGFASIVNSLQRFAIPANQLEVPETGVPDSEIYRFLYSDDAHTQPRYSAIVFPNGRVSYSNVQQGAAATEDLLWKSAFSYNQWEIFNDFSRNTGSRIVYLNEYPSNNTGTTIQYEMYTANQKITLVDATSLEELQNVDLNTDRIWHYPAKIDDEQELSLNYGFEYVNPLLYFEPDAEGKVPEKTVAAVECKNQGAEYAAFYVSFGDWSTTAAALNIFWLTWALKADIQQLSDEHITTAEALKKSAASKTARLAMGCLTISTLFVIIATLI